MLLGAIEDLKRRNEVIKTQIIHREFEDIFTKVFIRFEGILIQYVRIC